MLELALFGVAFRVECFNIFILLPFFLESEFSNADRFIDSPSSFEVNLALIPHPVYK